MRTNRNAVTRRGCRNRRRERGNVGNAAHDGRMDQETAITAFSPAVIGRLAAPGVVVRRHGIASHRRHVVSRVQTGETDGRAVSATCRSSKLGNRGCKRDEQDGEKADPGKVPTHVGRAKHPERVAASDAGGMRTSTQRSLPIRKVRQAPASEHHGVEPISRTGRLDSLRCKVRRCRPRRRAASEMLLSHSASTR